MPVFGKKFREQHFSLSPSAIPVNNGSYGVAPTVVLEEFHDIQWKKEGFPDRYLRAEQPLDVIASTKAIADIVDADYENLVFADSTSAGVNMVLRSFPFARGDKILFQTTTYSACINTVKFLALRYGVVPLTVQLDYPLSDDEVVEKFAQAMKAEAETGIPVKMCLFDAISSLPGLRVPFERIVQLCKDQDVISFVDGAHTVGQIPIALRTLQPDFFISNLHKWYMVPKGCAIVYVAPKYHRSIHSFPISHSFLEDDVVLPLALEATRLVDRFRLTLVSYFANITVVPAAIKFRNNVCGGETEISNYCYKLAQDVGDMLAARWGTSVLNNSHKESRQLAMVNVEVPVVPLELSSGWRKHVEEKMLENSVFVPLFEHNGKLYARFSCTVYNDMEDYLAAADLLLKFVNEVVN
ncbi:hypothetical protein BABINDRAFT_163483 [Babjeviella inositovora NRRL Y-12698]|uniref:Aminotransferase class V domain-containing protein n=1 Tax=Babjeviella inositovora NRRL Y-12698 TaxID=984486 RepID=A0A1E3QK63_9ASCO|nr:uncharacterized protein BABINDRAFT_163483 [Babjeviella inositovora NRRL Y-12698]ODQ77472.1 hypothetical protein BABINDRAFT_163483 [Babjeviella inositovora NRRL Y-12698]